MNFCVLNVMNWGDIYDSVWRARGPGVAQKVIGDIARLPIELVDAGLSIDSAGGRNARADQAAVYGLLCGGAGERTKSGMGNFGRGF
jgi:hypothetical protein